MMKFIGENDIEALPMRLDRLTQEEGVAAGAQLLGGMHDLVQHMRVTIGMKPFNIFCNRC